MPALTAGLLAAGLLLSLAAALAALLTRTTAADADRSFIRAVALIGQGCVLLALTALARYGYHLGDAARDCVYAAMAAAFLALATRMAGPQASGG